MNMFLYICLHVNVYIYIYIFIYLHNRIDIQNESLHSPPKSKLIEMEFFETSLETSKICANYVLG